MNVKQKARIEDREHSTDRKKTAPAIDFPTGNNEIQKNIRFAEISEWVVNFGCPKTRVAWPSFVKSTSEGRQPWAEGRNPFGIGRLGPLSGASIPLLGRSFRLQFGLAFANMRRLL